MQVPADPDAADPQAARFDRGCLGMLLALMVPLALFFAVAALNPDVASYFAAMEVRRKIIGAFRFGPVDAGALILAALSVRESLRAARKFIAGRAVWIEGAALRFHPTIRRRPLPLEEVSGITQKDGHFETHVVIAHGARRRLTVPMVDHDSARAFVAEAESARARLTFA